jgi:hypothetical protein
MLLSLFLIMFSGVRWQVLRKKRTSFAEETHVEDSEFGNSTRFRVIAGAETTGGEYFVMEALVRPGAYGVWRGAGPAGGGGLSSAPMATAHQRPGSEPPHSHAFQTEVVIVKSGMLGFWKGPRSGDEDGGGGGETAARTRPASAPGRGRTGVVGPGDAIVFAAGEPHSWWNAGVTDPNAEAAKKPKDLTKEDDKKKKDKKKKKKGDKDDAEAAAPAPAAATTADPGELLVQVVTWPAGPSGERLYENLAGLGHDYGSPLAVGPAQRALVYSRAASRLETVTPEGWASMEAWALPALEALGYKGLYPKYRSDLARAVDLDAAAQAYAEARAAHESGGADAEGEGGEGAKKVRGTGLRAELIAATMQGKEARRAKLEEIARKSREAQLQREQAGGEGEEAEVPPRRRQWHAGEEGKGGGAAGAEGGGAEEEEERREEERRRREEAQARRRRRDEDEEEEEDSKDEL